MSCLFAAKRRASQSLPQAHPHRSLNKKETHQMTEEEGCPEDRSSCDETDHSGKRCHYYDECHGEESSK